MVRRGTYEAAGLPVSMLGLGCVSWTKVDICKLLDHYDVQHANRYSKIELPDLLNDLIQTRNLTIEHRLASCARAGTWEIQEMGGGFLHIFRSVPRLGVEDGEVLEGMGWDSWYEPAVMEMFVV